MVVAMLKLAVSALNSRNVGRVLGLLVTNGLGHQHTQQQVSSTVCESKEIEREKKKETE